jgi:hypothetical protein
LGGKNTARSSREKFLEIEFEVVPRGGNRCPPIILNIFFVPGALGAGGRGVVISEF